MRSKPATWYIGTCTDADTGIIAQSDVADGGLGQGLHDGRQEVLHRYTDYDIMLGVGKKGGLEKKQPIRAVGFSLKVDRVAIQ